MGLLDGQIAIITGAGTGIGREAALMFANEGASLVLAGRRIEPLNEVVQLIESDGGTAVARSIDLEDIVPEISQMTEARPGRTIASRENIRNEPERTPDASIHGREPAFFASSYAKASRYQADRRFHCGLLPPQD